MNDFELEKCLIAIVGVCLPNFFTVSSCVGKLNYQTRTFTTVIGTSIIYWTEALQNIWSNVRDGPHA